MTMVDANAVAAWLRAEAEDKRYDSYTHGSDVADEVAKRFEAEFVRPTSARKDEAA